MACDLYRRNKYVVYGSYGPPIRNHLLLLVNQNFHMMKSKMMDQNCHSPYIYDGVQEQKLL